MERIIGNPYLSDAEKFQLLDTAIIATQTAVSSLSEKFEKDHKILVEGNGVLPIVEQVRNINRFIDDMKFWLKTVTVAVVLQTISFSGAALIYFLKLYSVLEKISKQP